MKVGNLFSKKRIESCGYYISCMLLFNILYFINNLLAIYKNPIFFENQVIGESQDTSICVFCSILASDCFNFITFFMVFSLIIFGIFSTLNICKRKNFDDSIPNSCKGTLVTVISTKNVTPNYYFTNYSLLVLTSISIPCFESIYSFLIYVIIFVSIGIVYIGNNCYAINPLLLLSGFKAYQCEYTFKNEDEDKICEATFLVKNGLDIKKDQKILVILAEKSVYRISNSKSNVSR